MVELMGEKVRNYFSKNPGYNALVHLLIGLGLGAILAYPVFFPHPIRWGLLLIGLGVLGHIYPLKLKK